MNNPASREDLLEDVACEHCLTLPERRVAKAATFVGNRLVVSVRGSAELTVWDVQTGSLTGILQGHTGEVKALACIAPGVLASAGSEGQLRVWDMLTAGTSQGQSHSCIKVIPGDVRRMVMVPESGSVITAAYSGPHLALWLLEGLTHADPPDEALQELPEVFQLHSDEEDPSNEEQPSPGTAEVPPIPRSDSPQPPAFAMGHQIP